MPTLSRTDLSLIKSRIKPYKENLDINENQNAFYFLVLELLFNLMEDEIEDSITDNYYLSKVAPGSHGHDRGIDVVYIDENSTPPTVHLFNFKYTDKFEKLGNHLPSSEIDKTISFITDLMSSDSIETFANANKVLQDKVVDIWKLMDAENPNYILHFCSNHYQGFEKSEKERLENRIKRHSFSCEYHLMDDLISLITSRDKIIVNGRIKGLDKRFFEKSEGDIRALILEVSAIDLLRLVSSDESIRDDVNLEGSSG